MSQNAHLKLQTENYNKIARMKNCSVEKICPIQMEYNKTQARSRLVYLSIDAWVGLSINQCTLVAKKIYPPIT